MTADFPRSSPRVGQVPTAAQVVVLELAALQAGVARERVSATSLAILQSHNRIRSHGTTSANGGYARRAICARCSSIRRRCASSREVSAGAATASNGSDRWAHASRLALVRSTPARKH
jgi:hypothetical protein